MRWVALFVVCFGCSSAAPPTKLRRGPCLPVLQPCGECVLDCLQAEDAGGKRYSLPVPDGAHEGRMGSPEAAALTLIEHCDGDGRCGRVYRMPLRGCYGSCPGPTQMLECRMVEGRCATMGPQ